MITANIGPNNRIGISVSGGTFGTGLVDAYHTVNVLGVTVPDGIGWEYQGVTGNPLNFDYAGSASPVPEPAAFQLLGAGISALALFVRRKSTVCVR